MTQLTKTLPRHHYSRDPLDILIDKENATTAKEQANNRRAARKQGEKQ